MKHTEAMNANAAERYLLGELTETEAESFEDHFFECRACGEDIRAGARMLEALREVVREDKPESIATEVVPFPIVKRRTWLPIAAAAMLLIGIGFGRFILPGEPNSPQLEFATLYLGGAVRGAADENVVPSGHKNLFLQVDVASTTPFPSYVLTVRDERGKQVALKAVSAAQTEEPVPLLLSELPAGSYVVVIEGVREDGKRSKVTTLPFRVR